MKLLRFMLLSLGVALFASVQAQTSPTLRLEPYANPLVVPNYTKGATYYFDLMKTDGTYGDAFVELKYLIEYSPNTAVSGWDTVGRIFDEYGGMIVESKLHMGLSTFSSHDTLHAWSGSFPTYIGLDGYSRLIRLSALDTATLLSIHFDKPGFYRVSYMFEQYSCPSAAPYEVVTSKNGAVSMGLISYHMTLFHIQDSILPSAEVTPALPAVLSTGYQHRVGVRMDAGSYQYHHYTVPAYILYSVKKQNPATMAYEPISISDFGSFSLNYHGSAVAGDSAGRLPSGANTAVLLDSVHNDTLDFDFLCKIGQGGLYQVQVQMYQYDTNRYHFMDHDTVRHGLLMDTCFYLNFAEVPEKLLRLSPCDRPDTVINYTKGGTYYFDLLKRNSIFGNEMVEMRYVMEYSSDGTTWSNTGLVFDDYGGMITTSTLNTVMGSFSERDTLHDWTGAFPSYVGVDGYTRLIRLNALDTASLVTMRFDKFGHYRVVYQLHRYTVPGLMPYDVVASKNGATWGSLISSDTTVFHIQDSILPTGELTPAQPAVVSTGYPHTVGVRIDAGSYRYPHYTVPAYLRYNVKKQNPSTMAYEPVSISDFGSFSLNFHGYSTVDSAGRLPSGATNYVMLNTLHNDTMKFDLQCTPGKGGWYQINVQLYQYDTNRYSMDTVHHGMLMDTSYYLYFDELPEKLLWLHPTERPDTMINYTKGGIYFFDLMKRNSIFGEEMVELRYIMEYSQDSVSWTNTGMVFDEYGGMITTSRLHVGMGVVTEDDTLHDWTGSFPTSLGIDGYPRLIRLKALDTGSLVTLRFEKGGYYRVVYQFHRYTVPGLASWDVVVSKNGTTWKSLISSDTTVFHVMDSLLPSCEMTSTLPSVLGTGSVQKVKVRLDAGSYQYHHYTIPSYIYYNVKRLNPATSLYEPAVLDSFSLSFHGYSTVDSAGRLPAGATSYMMLDSIHNDTLYFDLQCPPGQGGMYQINIQLYQYDTNRYQYNMDTVRHGLLLDSSYYLFFDELPDKLLQLKPYNRPDTVVNYTKGATYYFDLMKRNGFFGNDMMELRYEIEYSTDGTTWSNTGMVFDDYGEMISTSTLNTIVGSFSQCDTVHNWTGVFPAYVGVDGYTRLIRLGALDTGSLLTMRFDKAGYYRVVYQFHRYTVPGLMPYDVFVSKNGATWRSLASSDTTLFHVKDSILPSAEVTPALPAILSVGQSHQVGIRIDAGSYQHSNYTAPAYLEYSLSKYDSTLSQYVQINSIGTFGSFAMSYKNDTVSAGGVARLPLGPRSYVMLDSLHNDTLKLDFLCLPTQKGWYAMNVRLMQYDTNRYHYTDRDTVRHATLMDTVYYMYFNELKKPTLKIDPKPCSVEVPTEVTQQYNLVVNAKEYVDSSATIVCTIKYNGTEISDWSNYLDTTYVTLNDSVCLIDPTTKRMLYNVPLTRLENSSIKHFINFRVAGNYTMAYSMYVNNNLATSVVLTYVCSDTLMLSPGDKVHPSAQSTLRAEAYPLGVQDTFNVYVHAAEYENTYTQIALKLFYSQDSGQTLIPIDSVNVFGSAKVRMDANAIGYTGMADERVFTTHRDTVHPMYIYRLGAVAGVPFEFISRWDSAGTYVYTYEILQWDCFDADSLETMTYMHSPIYGRVSKTGGRPKAVLYRDTLMMHVYPQYLNEWDSIELCASNLPREYNGTGYCVSASLGTAISGGPITTTARDTLIIPLKTIHGMDSIIHLAVKVHPSHVTYFKDTLRGVGAYSNHGFNEVFNMPGRYVLSQTLTNTFGCDSVVTDSLVVVPTHLFEDSVTICSSELPYTWRGRTLSAANTYYDSLKTAIYAADSVYKMILKVN
ncbi:MAG: hypothetical protein J5873_01130, partial [Bacteroidales bacterium]|nr:hypothetical protein [Bacteroidales bacterium]